MQSLESDPPAGCPFPRSGVLKGIAFTERHACYTNADTWYPSWAADGALYSPWTDGYVRAGGRDEPFDDDHPGVRCYSIDGPGHTAITAQARIAGDDPLHLTVEVVGEPVPAAAAPYRGRYPCANLVHDGVWYYGTYSLGDFDMGESRCLVGYDVLGPFVGFRTSRDGGRTWTESPHTPSAPLFGEDPEVVPVRFGVPHVVDLGRELEHSPDGKMYLLAHGSRPGAVCATFMHGDYIFLARVPPDPDAVNDPAAYEFFAGHDEGGEPLWTRDFDAMAPVATWEDHLGSVTATYVPGLGRYLMFVTRAITADVYDTMILESPTLTGPWSLVSYLEAFGPYGYFVNLPSKFIDDSGTRAWLCYSANWRKKEPMSSPPAPPGSTYALCLQELLITPT